MINNFIILTILSLNTIESQFNGSFYPSKEKETIQLIENIFKETQSKPHLLKSIAAIVPHAGYIYSGQIAASVYKSLPYYENYFIISPSHKYWFENAIVCDESFNTPLGTIETNKEIIKKLASNKTELIKIDCSKFIGEHAVEVQLPFLQYRFKKSFKIIPLLINTQNIEKIKKIAKLIVDETKNYREKIYYLISSDLSHYPEYEKANLLDLTLSNSIKTMDLYYIDLTAKILLSKKIENYLTPACGLSGIMLGSEISNLMGFKNFEILEYKNSYDTNPTYSKKNNVVGYLAGVFTKTNKNENGIVIEYTKNEKKELLNIARKAIEDSFLNKNSEENQLYNNIKFNLPQAVFVTLTINNNLRGCMGTTQPQLSLADAVKYFAQIAAFKDPRFKPLQKEELDKIKIEISILSPLRKVKDYTQINIGKDGVVINSKNGSGLFLPQVWEYFPKKEDFLSELCVEKAGLSSDCWKSKEVEIYTFTVEKFSEL
ncbi:MAG: AmmeMemoRadiSam system protein B [Elusimicrobiales bacterium]|nr:AmmeMemoRadiSam system protein B [Elusimicrobiales bacterium]